MVLGLKLGYREDVEWIVDVSAVDRLMNLVEAWGNARAPRFRCTLIEYLGTSEQPISRLMP